MSVTHYDPISAGQTSYSNTPYQYWKGHVSDSRLKTIEFSLNNRTFLVEIDKDGNWELQLPLRLEEGSHNLAVRYISHSGVYGELLQRQIMVDFSPPEKPVITAVLDDVGSVKGPVAPGGFTDDEKPTITGFAEPDSVVRVYSNGELIGSVQAAKNGSWQLDAPLGKGLHNVYVTASDNYNQVSEPSDTYPLRINVPLVDQPVLLSVTDNEGLKQGAIAHNGQTDDKTPQLSGAAPLDAIQVNIYVNGLFVAGVPVHDGKWSWTSSYPILNDGSNVITLRAQNIRGEVSEETSPFNVTVSPDPIETPQILKAVDDFGSVKGDLKSGGLTDDTTPVLHGTGTPGAIIEIQYGLSTEGWRAAGTAVVDARGNWSFTSPILTSEGTWEYRARANVDGRTGGYTGKFKVVLSTEAPEAPQILSAFDNAGPVTGVVGNKGLTDDRTPELGGKGAPGSIIYFNMGKPGGSWIAAGSTVVAADGTWKYTPPQVSGDGTWQYRAQSAHGGKLSAWSGSFSLNISKDAASAPEITHAADNAGAVQGDVKHGGITDDKTPTLHGKGVPGAVVEVKYSKAGGEWVVAGSAVVDASGNWRLTSPDLKTDGSVSFAARTVNGVKISDWSNTFTLKVYATADKAPEITHAVDDAGAVQGNLKNGDITDDRTPTLHGKGVPGAVIQVQYNKAGTSGWTVAGSAVVDASGNWRFTTPDLKADGTVYFIARSVNGAKVSDWTDYFTVRVYASADKAPEITHAVDNAGAVQGDVKHGGFTDDKTPTLKGKGVPGAVVEFEYGKYGEAWKAAGSAVVDANGNWSFTSPALGSDGTWEYRARSVNGANKSSWTGKFVINLDTTPPAEPVITGAYDNEGSLKLIADQGVTKDKTPELRGKAEPNSKLILVLAFNGENWGSWNKSYEVMTDANGNWKIKIPDELADGRWHFRVKSVDAAGNTTGLSPQYYFEVIAAPVITHVLDDAGTVKGNVQHGGVTDDKTPTLKGKGEPGAIIEVIFGLSSDGWKSAGSAKVDASGNWSLTSPELAKDGVWEYRARSISGSKVSPYTEKFIFNLDTTPPVEPVINGAYANEDGLKSLRDQGVTADKTPELRGTAEPNSKLILVLAFNQEGWEGKNKTYEVMTDDKGNWTVKIPDELAYGRWYFRAKSVDAAGNTTGLSPQYYFNVILPPLITGAYDNEGAIKLIADQGMTTDKTPELRGTAEPNSKLILVLAKGAESWGSWNKTYEVMTDANGNWTVKIPEQLADGRWHFRVKSVEASGDETQFSPQYYFDVVSASAAQDITQGGYDINTANAPVSLLGIDESTTTMTVDQDHIELSALLAQQNAQGRVDLSGNGSNTLSVDVASLLQHGETNLFIDDGKTQMLIKGDSNDIIKLSDILPSGEKEGSWSQQTGQITVGGVAYNVYSHSGADAELLVQQGVKTELV
ncbi:Ig-like domain-containing protein [Pantoea dispersa]|uniref:Ig-like domain-containing protein n=1 Tax=Pantoea dispersa TaxID=59814 RepID=UPI0014793C93|nr:Ig-like domain-containing protein [Pantoea dispersa]